jgi:hypothetical protein
MSSTRPARRLSPDFVGDEAGFRLFAGGKYGVKGFVESVERRRRSFDFAAKNNHI